MRIERLTYQYQVDPGRVYTRSLLLDAKTDRIYVSEGVSIYKTLEENNHSFYELFQSKKLWYYTSKIFHDFIIEHVNRARNTTGF